MMSESERQYYLGKAGIHIWYARAPLPGAAPSPEFRFPVDDSVPEPESDLIPPRPSRPASQRPVADGAGREKIAGIQALMAGSETEASETPKPVSADVSPAGGTERASSVDPSPALDVAPEPARQGQIVAHLGCWVSERMVLVSGMSDEASERLQETLAANILAALGERMAGESRHIRWPVFGNPRVPGNSGDDFHGLLRSVSSEFGSKKLICLGVLMDDMPAGRSEWLASALGTPSVDFPRSLAELAAVPEYKRELWHQLRSAVGA